MADMRYSTVAEDYRSGKSRLYSAGRERGRGRDEAMGRGELLRWIQLVVCAAIFLALVVAKINMPARFESLRAAFSAQMEHSVDYREVFSAVGRAVSGEESLQKVAEMCIRDRIRRVLKANLKKRSRVMRFSNWRRQQPRYRYLQFSKHLRVCSRCV